MNARIKNYFLVFLFLTATALWFSSPLDGKERPEVYVNLGLSYYELGQYDKAVEKFQNALELDPK